MSRVRDLDRLSAIFGDTALAGRLDATDVAVDAVRAVALQPCAARPERTKAS